MPLPVSRIWMLTDSSLVVAVAWISTEVPEYLTAFSTRFIRMLKRCARSADTWRSLSISFLTTTDFPVGTGTAAVTSSNKSWRSMTWIFNGICSTLLNVMSQFDCPFLHIFRQRCPGFDSQKIVCRRTIGEDSCRSGSLDRIAICMREADRRQLYFAGITEGRLPAPVGRFVAYLIIFVHTSENPVSKTSLIIQERKFIASI